MCYYDSVEEDENEATMDTKSAVAFVISKELNAMPSWPKRPCSHPGCPNLTNKRFCPEHEKQENKRYEKYGRDPSTKKRYGKSWEKISTQYRKAHPFCEICFAKGVAEPAVLVHHKVPLRNGGTNDESNLQALCMSCHSRIHAEHGDRWH